MPCPSSSARALLEAMPRARLVPVELGWTSAPLGTARRRPPGADRVPAPVAAMQRRLSDRQDRPCGHDDLGHRDPVIVERPAPPSPAAVHYNLSLMTRRLSIVRGARRALLGRSRRGRARRGGGHGPVPTERSGVLVARRRCVGAQRQLPVGQPAVERAAVSVRDPRADARREGRSRLSRRGAGTELHLHRLAQAVDRLHRRHPPRQSGSASAVQGAVRVVGQTAPNSSGCCSRGRGRQA